MNKTILTAALAGLMISGVAASASAGEAAAPAKEKCYGIAKAGKNDCASKDASHSCAGHATKDNSPNEFVLVDHGTCETKGGKTATENKDMMPK